jgi:hypothetical protein
MGLPINETTTQLIVPKKFGQFIAWVMLFQLWNSLFLE